MGHAGVGHCSGVVDVEDEGEVEGAAPVASAAFTGEPGMTAVLWTAVSRSSPGSAISHHAAAEMHQLSVTVSSAIQITVPLGRQVRGATGMVVHR